MAYVSQAEIKKYLGINWTSGLDTFIDTIIAGATTFVERYCGDDRFGKRVFEAPDPDSDEIRYFNGNDDYRLYFGDLRTLTSLVFDGEVLTINDDFYLYPLNATVLDEPYRWVELIQPSTRLNTNSRLQSSSPYVFDDGQKLITVTGKWGYATTPPDDVKLAVMKLVGGVIKENIGDNDLREVTAETLGEYSTSFAKIKDIAHALGVDVLLAKYKRPNPPTVTWSRVS